MKKNPTALEALIAKANNNDADLVYIGFDPDYAKNSIEKKLSFFDFPAAIKIGQKSLFPSGKITADNLPNNYEQKTSFILDIANAFVDSIVAYSAQQMLYVYNDKLGYYQKYTAETFGPVLTNFLRKTDFLKILNRKNKSEVFKVLVDMPKLQADVDFFDNQENYINVENGVVELSTLQLLPHDQKYGFTNVIHGKFTPEILNDSKRRKKSVFLNMLKASFPDKDDRIRALQSMAYGISNCYSAKTAWYWYGVTNSGKSTLLKVLENLIGTDLISNVSLKNLASRFAPSALYKKRLNCNAESNSMSMTDLTSFKIITGNDTISIEYKKQTAFSAKLKTHLFFASNSMLHVAGSASDEAVFSRFQFLVFDVSIDKDDRDPTLEQKLKDEADIILTILINTLRDWYCNDCRFHPSKASQKYDKVLRMGSSDTVKSFLKNACKKNDTSILSVDDLYKAYQTFCKNNNGTALQKDPFLKYFYKISGKRSEKISHKRQIVGIKLT